MAHEIFVRAVEASDADRVHELICALAENEGARSHVRVTPARLAETAAGKTPSWRGYIAERDGEAVGIVTYTEDFHIWRGAPRITIDDLYVRADRRRRGIGEALMRRVFGRAAERGAVVGWTVEADNERAIDFYRRLGAECRIVGKCSWSQGQ